MTEKVIDGLYVGGNIDFLELKKREGVIVRGY